MQDIFGHANETMNRQLFQSQLIRTALLGVFLMCLVSLDQWSKYWIVQHMVFNEAIEMIPGFFSIVYTYNLGTAFGLFSQLPDHVRPYVVIALPTLMLFILFILFYTREFRSWIATIALSSVIAGGVGNLIDRYLQGYVVDFLLFDLGFMLWPAFNVADICVSVGGTLLLIYFGLIYKASPLDIE